MLESVSIPIASRLHSRSTVDEMFLAEFIEEHLGYCLCSRRVKSHKQQMVCCGIDGGVQPVSLVIELDHGFVNRKVIRVSTFSRL